MDIGRKFIDLYKSCIAGKCFDLMITYNTSTCATSVEIYFIESNVSIVGIMQ